MGGDIGILDVDDESIFLRRPHEETVDVVDIDFRLQQGAQHVFYPVFTFNFGGEHTDFGEGEIVVDHKFPRAIGIIDQETQDRAVRGVQNRQCDDVDIVGLKHRAEIVESAHSIFGEDRKLFHRIQSDCSCELRHEVQ